MGETNITDVLEYQRNVLCVIEVWRWVGHADVLACRSPETDCVPRHKHQSKMLGYTRDAE